MNPIKTILQRALDEALAAHVIKLFGVLCTTPDDDAIDRFLRDTEKATERYRTIRALFAEKQI
jgi:hypothetical protein